MEPLRALVHYCDRGDVGPQQFRTLAHRREVVIVVVVVVYLTLTDPLRIQPRSQDRRNQTKSIREQFGRKKEREEKRRESRQKTTDKKIASKGHRRQEGTQKRLKEKNKTRNINTNKKAQTEETNKKQSNTLLSRLRKKGSPISGGIQPRQEDKGRSAVDKHQESRPCAWPAPSAAHSRRT